MHQWPLTLALSLVLAGWAAGEALSERAWVGPIAGALAGVLPGNLQLAARPPVAMSSAHRLQAPSGSLAVLVMLGLVGPTVLILRRQGTKGAWAAMVLLLALSAGTKPTVLPIMVVGCVVAGLFAWLAERRFPWHQVALAALAVGFFAAGSTVNLMGSTGGSRLQLLAVLRTMPFYKQVTGDKSYPATGGWLVPSVASGNARMIVVRGNLGGLVPVRQPAPTVLPARYDAEPGATRSGVLVGGWLCRGGDRDHLRALPGRLFGVLLPADRRRARRSRRRCRSAADRGADP